MAKRRVKKSKRLQASSNITAKQLSYLERRRVELQKEYNKAVRREKNPAIKQILKENRASLRQANLKGMLQAEDITYNSLKSVFNDLSRALREVKIGVEQLTVQRQTYTEPKEKITFYVDEDKNVRKLQQGETLYQVAGEGAVASMEFEVSRSLINELNDTINKVNEKIGEHRLEGEEMYGVMPDYFSKVKVAEQLTDEDSYKREIERLKKFLKEDAFDLVKTGDGTGMITKGEKDYLESRLIEENKRREESIKFQEEELQKTGRLQSQHEYQQKPIDFSKYSKEQLKKRSDIYTDIEIEKRSELWKNNYMKMIQTLVDTVWQTNTISKEDKQYIDQKGKDIANILSTMRGEQVKQAILGSPDIEILANYPDADLVKETLDRAYTALLHYS